MKNKKTNRALLATAGAIGGLVASGLITHDANALEAPVVKKPSEPVKQIVVSGTQKLAIEVTRPTRLLDVVKNMGNIKSPLTSTIYKPDQLISKNDMAKEIDVLVDILYDDVMAGQYTTDDMAMGMDAMGAIIWETGGQPGESYGGEGCSPTNDGGLGCGNGCTGEGGSGSSEYGDNCGSNGCAGNQGHGCGNGCSDGGKAGDRCGMGCGGKIMELAGDAGAICAMVNPKTGLDRFYTNFFDKLNGLDPFVMTTVENFKAQILMDVVKKTMVVK